MSTGDNESGDKEKIVQRFWLISVSLYCLISDYYIFKAFYSYLCMNLIKRIHKSLLVCWWGHYAVSWFILRYHKYPVQLINIRQREARGSNGCQNVTAGRRLSFGFGSTANTYGCNICDGEIYMGRWVCTCQTQIRTCWRAPQSRLIRHGLSPGIISITYQVSSI